MGTTNFEHSVNTAALSLRENTECHVIIKRLNTGRYKYEARLKYIPGKGTTIYVIKDDMCGRLISIIGISKISVSELEYDRSEGYIPQRLVKDIISFYKALINKVNQ